MVVRHNLPAMNSTRQLGINNSSTAKNLEKLSSGFRINRAGDDAAGLAISEKMRGQIRGLDMANQNAENGISLIQTAEGALNETHAILQRIRELAVQSANGTYHDKVDRENLNKEVQALKSEVDRISSSTHYNGINLLDGTIGAKTADEWKIPISGGPGHLDSLHFLTNLGLHGGVGSINVLTTHIPGDKAKLVVSKGDDSGTNTVSLEIGGKTYGIDPANNKDFVSIEADGSSTVVASLSVGFNPASGLPGVLCYGVVEIDAYGGAGSYALNNSNNKFSFLLNQKDNPVLNVDYNGFEPKLTFQIGANGTSDQKVGLYIENMGTGHLGDHAGTPVHLAGTRVVNVDVSNIEKANESITVINAAINQVSGTRADLGALQNRLEHTINNLGVAKENLQNAESGIRDVDMAKEMMDFTKNNILAQASQSMLAQANQMPQGIIQLLAA